MFNLEIQDRNIYVIIKFIFKKLSYKLSTDFYNKLTIKKYSS